MGLNWRQFELGVLRPALEGEPEVAIKLVGETIWHESDRLQALGQYVPEMKFRGALIEWDNIFGPGLGIASIEKPTWDWMMDRDDVPETLQFCEYKWLAYDLELNVLACRFRYKLDKRALPENTILNRSFYWLNVYNGSGVDERRLDYVVNAHAIPWVK